MEGGAQAEALPLRSSVSSTLQESKQLPMQLRFETSRVCSGSEPRQMFASDQESSAL
jgi:hypothetical protein